HDGGLPFIAQRINERTKLVAIHSLNSGRKNLDAFHLTGLRFQLRSFGVSQAIFELREFMLQSLLAREKLFDLIDHFAFTRSDDPGDTIDLLLGFLEFLERPFSRDGFDPSHAGGNGALVDDLADADIPCAGDVCAAAEFLRKAAVADSHHANLVTVLFA